MMNPKSALPLAHNHHAGPDAAWILRLALTWFVYVFAFVSLGVSGRKAFIGYRSVAPKLHMVASGFSTVRSILAGAGINDPLDFLRLS